MKKILLVVVTAVGAGVVQKKLDAQQAEQDLWAEATDYGPELGHHPQTPPSLALVPAWHRPGAMAQLVAHLLCKQGVRGSSPLGSTQVRGPFRSPGGASVAARTSKVQQAGSWPLRTSPRRSSACRLGRRRGHLAVEVHRHGDLAVAQDRHRHPRVDIQGDKQRRACPPSRVHRHDGDFGLAALEL